MHTSEMLWASMQVINHRTTRMMTSGVQPSPRDRTEFTRMGQEKVDAVMESAMAMSMRYALANQQFAIGCWKEAMAGAASMMQLGFNPAAQLAAGKQFTLPHQAFKSFSTLASQFFGSAAHIGQQGLRPIHSRATSNAKRLGKLNPVGGAPLGTWPR
jgi:hypothetical protein